MDWLLLNNCRPPQSILIPVPVDSGYTTITSIQVLNFDSQLEVFRWDTLDVGTDITLFLNNPVSIALVDTTLTYYVYELPVSAVERQLIVPGLYVVIITYPGGMTLVQPFLYDPEPLALALDCEGIEVALELIEESYGLDWHGEDPVVQEDIFKMINYTRSLTDAPAIADFRTAVHNCSLEIEQTLLLGCTPEPCWEGPDQYYSQDFLCCEEPDPCHAGETFAFGNCLDFDGNNDYVIIENPGPGNTNPLFNMDSDEFSLSFWVKVNDKTKGVVFNNLLLNDFPAQRNGLSVSFLPSLGLRFVLSSVNPNTNARGENIVYGSSAAFSNGTWHHVVFTKQGNCTQDYYVFVDGQDRTTRSLPGQLCDYPAGAAHFRNELPILLGHSYHASNSANALNGRLDEFQVYIKALTLADAQALYNSGSGAFANDTLCDGLIVYWRFDESLAAPSAGASVRIVKDEFKRNNGYLKRFHDRYFTTSCDPARVPHAASENTPCTCSEPFDSGFAFGNALRLDGINDFIMVPPDALDFDRGDFSISLWMRPESVAADAVLLQKIPSSNLHAGISLQLIPASSGTIRLVYTAKGISRHNDLQIPGLPGGTHVWYHVVLSKHGADGTEYRLYLNGVDLSRVAVNQLPSALEDFPDIDNISGPTPLIIGASGSGTGAFFKGWVDEVAVYNRVLRDEEVLCMYNGGNGGGLPAVGLTQHWDFNEENAASQPGQVVAENTVNASYNGVLRRFFERTVKVPECDTAWLPHGQTSLPEVCACEAEPDTSFAFGNALQFDGVNDYVTIPNHAAYQFGTGDFTISYWIKRPNITQTGAVVLRKVVSSTTGGVNFGLIPRTSSGLDQGMDILVLGDTLVPGSTTSNRRARLASSVLSPNAWHHVVMVRSAFGSGDHSNPYYYKVYVDGVERGIVTEDLFFLGSGAGNVNNTAPFILGASNPPTAFFFTGTLDELQLYDRALTQEEVKCMYNSGNGSAPYFTGLVGYWDMNVLDGDSIEDGSATDNPGTVTGATLVTH
ncbi:MAG: LamG domain-containing protein [Bacteroidetes bacterium]|nr:LamG domain-containing protein [Bacteroidota bacterium]